MKILLTGANGYVGKRLLPELLQLNHEVICCVRDKNRLGLDAATLSKISIWEIDFLEEPNFDAIPKDIDVAFYLIHSMTASSLWRQIWRESPARPAWTTPWMPESIE